MVFPVARLECQACGLARQVDIAFAELRRSYTKSFERYGLESSQSMTIRDAARQLNVGWNQIKDIQKRDLSWLYVKPTQPKHIVINETAIANGDRYVTVVMDLDGGAVVFVGDGKGADLLKPFSKRLRRGGAKIEAVAIDMSVAYRGAVNTHLPDANIVLDRFHVIKLFNDRLSEL